MGGLVIEKVRPGVEFTPDAAAAFRRAEAQVQREFSRNIDVNSTYRSWATQLKMYNDWNAYVAGRGPYPSHSKAVHPSESFHVQGVALDSDDWVNTRIRAILAENGFIRNRLSVPGENHHFEYIRAQDKNYGVPAVVPTHQEDEMFPAVLEIINDSNAGKSLYDLRTGRAIRAISKSENTSLRKAEGRGMCVYISVDKTEYRARGGK